MVKKMSAEDLEAAFAEETESKNLCSLGAALRDMDPDLRAVVASKVDDNIRYSNRVIAKVLKRVDVTVSAEMVGRHRKSDCRCK